MPGSSLIRAQEGFTVSLGSLNRLDLPREIKQIISCRQLSMLTVGRCARCRYIVGLFLFVSSFRFDVCRSLEFCLLVKLSKFWSKGIQL